MTLNKHHEFKSKQVCDQAKVQPTYGSTKPIQFFVLFKDGHNVIGCALHHVHRDI